MGSGKGLEERGVAERLEWGRWAGQGAADDITGRLHVAPDIPGCPATPSSYANHPISCRSCSLSLRLRNSYRNTGELRASWAAGGLSFVPDLHNSSTPETISLAASIA